MKKLFFLATLLLTIFIKAGAQGLKIGDKVPDFNIGKLINYPKEQLKFSAIKSRLIILDYWSTSCSSCIAGLPKMDSVQKKFKDEILILPVTHEKIERIKTFWAKSKYTKNIALPTIVEDTLNKYFPHQGVPFEVWILDGKVFAFTGPEKVNQEEIRDVLAGKPKNWALPLPSDYLRKPSVKLSLLKPVSENAVSVFYSTISTIDPAFHVQPLNYDNLSENNRTFTRVMLLTRPIPQLYNEAYRYIYGNKTNWMFKQNRVVLEVKNWSRYFCADPRSSAEWVRNNSYSYEAILPPNISKYEMGNYIKTDLDKFFGLEASIQQREVMCWVLSLKKGTDSINDQLSNAYRDAENRFEQYRLIKDPVTKSDALNEMQNDQQYKEKYNDKKFDNASEIVWYINHIYQSVPNSCPVIDETGYKENFNISMRLSNPYKRKPSFDEFRIELNRHGFDLKKEVKKLEMLVITEKGLNRPKANKT